MRRLVVTSVLGGLLAVPLLGLQGPASAAATLTVGTASSSCSSPQYATIASAVADAHSGDTIVVCAGTYAESISDQGKNLTFLGARAGVDGRGRATDATDESRVQPATGHPVTLTGVSSVDGFRLVAPAGGDGVGVTFSSHNSRLTDSVLTGASTAVLLQDSDETVDHNQIEVSDGSTDVPPTSDGRGVVGNGYGSDSKVQDNAFSGDLTGGAVALSGLGPFEVSGNSADLDVYESLVVANNTTGLRVLGNEITGTVNGLDSRGVRLTGADDDFTVFGNRFTNVGEAVELSSPNGSGTINQNSVHGGGYGVDVYDPTGAVDVHSNIFAGVATEAIDNSNTNPQTLQAQNNFFGCNQGPTGSNGCSGVPASGVLATPYLVLTSSIGTHSAAIGQAVPFTATLQRNSDGQVVSLPVLDGEPIAFAYTRGTAMPAAATLVNGQATTTVRPTSAGSGTVTATVDSATTSQTLNSAVRPTIRIGDAGTAEGNSGSHALVFRVTLSRRTTVPVTVKFTTANSSATAPSDYTAKSGTVTFPAGATARTVSISVHGDRTHEPNESFAVNIFSPTNATIADPVGVGVIRNDD